jgi:hypothetical protein
MGGRGLLAARHIPHPPLLTYGGALQPSPSTICVIMKFLRLKRSAGVQPHLRTVKKERVAKCQPTTSRFG